MFITSAPQDKLGRVIDILSGVAYAQLQVLLDLAAVVEYRQ